MRFTFIAKHRGIWPVAWLCEALDVSRSGFHAWLNRSPSRRARDDEEIGNSVRASFLGSDRTYGARRVWRDVLAEGIDCGLHRIERLMRAQALRARPRRRSLPKDGGQRSAIAPNTLGREFHAERPNQRWIADFTYIRTHEGFAYLAVVIDLFSRRVVGWSMQARQTTNVVLQALLAAVWRRKPKDRVLVHSDQGSQFTSMEWASFLKHHDLQPSMSRRGNCHDNAVAESFFNLLKRERIRRKVYRTRDEARRDVFDYIEMFYNPTRKHARNGMLSPVEFERQHKAKAEGV